MKEVKRTRFQIYLEALKIIDNGKNNLIAITYGIGDNSRHTRESVLLPLINKGLVTKETVPYGSKERDLFHLTPEGKEVLNYFESCKDPVIKFLELVTVQSV